MNNWKFNNITGRVIWNRILDRVWINAGRKLFTTDTEVETVIGKAEFLTPTFLELEIESISESVLQLELEAWNTSNEKWLVMLFDDILESVRRLQR